jgi:biopolymer transport protein ExbB
MIDSTLPNWLFLAQDGAARRTNWFEIIQSGGLIGYILILLSVFAMAMVIMQVMQLRRKSIIPPQHVEVLDSFLSRGDINASLDYCLKPENDSFITRILATGLTRYQRSAFGAFEIKNAVEEAGEEQTARLYRATDVLSVIGSVAPLLGLLGTVLGMVGAFDTLGAGTSPDHTQLAKEISLALVCTLLGLVLAIPCLALFTFFRNRIDALAAEAAREIERLLLYLEATPGARPVAPPARGGFVPRQPAVSSPMGYATGGSPASAAEGHA